MLRLRQRKRPPEKRKCPSVTSTQTFQGQKTRPGGLKSICTHSINVLPSDAPADIADILEPMVDAAWQVRRRDPWRGDRILQALHRLLYMWRDIPLPGEEPQTNGAEKRINPADNRVIQDGGEYLQSTLQVYSRVTSGAMRADEMAVIRESTSQTA